MNYFEDTEKDGTQKWTVRIKTVDSAGRSTVYETNEADKETMRVILGAVGQEGYLLMELDDGRLASIPASLITEAVATEVDNG